MQPKDDGVADLRDPVRISRRRTLRSFAGLGVAAAAGYGSWRWLMSRAEEDGVPWPIRRVLRFNERLSEGIFHDGSSVDRRAAGSAPVGSTRLNTDIGVDPSMAAGDYRLRLTGVAGGTAAGEVALTLDDLRAFPKVLQTTRLCCVEGWDTWGNWGGARLADVAAKFRPLGSPPYVALSTPGGGYYVGLDLASAMHPESLLAYELDGQPLSAEHGQPVRLVIPTKYGIKNIKQVTTVAFTATRPPDYWAERGYDWYAGL